MKNIESMNQRIIRIAKELYAAEEKKEFKDLDYRGQDLAVRAARKEAGLPEEARMNDNVSVQTRVENRDQKGHDIEIGVNWKSMGTKELAETKKFADELNEALKKARKLADVLKNRFPGIKLKGI